MGEFANFRFAPERMKRLENGLMGAADLVSTGGGRSVFEAKRHTHD